MAEYQRCIVRVVRSTLKYAAGKDKKAFANDLKTICRALGRADRVDSPGRGSSRLGAKIPRLHDPLER